MSPAVAQLNVLLVRQEIVWIWPAAVAVVGATLLVGCSSQPTVPPTLVASAHVTAAATVAPAQTRPRPRSAPPCHSDQLSASYRFNQGSGQMLLGAYVLRNLSHRPCAVRGIVTIDASNAGRRMRLLTWHTGPRGRLVVLSAGHPGYIFTSTESTDFAHPLRGCPQAEVIELSLRDLSSPVPVRTENLHGKDRAVHSFCNRWVRMGPVSEAPQV